VPSVNQQLTTGYSTVTYEAPVGEVTPEQQDALTAAVEDAGDGALTVEVTGQAIQEPPHVGGPPRRSVSSSRWWSSPSPMVRWSWPA
jgi:RND superfamily putative drug exporter